MHIFLRASTDNILIRVFFQYAYFSTRQPKGSLQLSGGASARALRMCFTDEESVQQGVDLLLDRISLEGN